MNVCLQGCREYNRCAILHWVMQDNLNISRPYEEEREIYNCDFYLQQIQPNELSLGQS